MLGNPRRAGFIGGKVFESPITKDTVCFANAANATGAWISEESAFQDGAKITRSETRRTKNDSPAQRGGVVLFPPRKEALHFESSP